MSENQKFDGSFEIESIASLLSMLHKTLRRQGLIIQNACTVDDDEKYAAANSVLLVAKALTQIDEMLVEIACGKFDTNNIFERVGL